MSASNASRAVPFSRRELSRLLRRPVQAIGQRRTGVLRQLGEARGFVQGIRDHAVYRRKSSIFSLLRHHFSAIRRERERRLRLGLEAMDVAARAPVGGDESMVAVEL